MTSNRLWLCLTAVLAAAGCVSGGARTRAQTGTVPLQWTFDGLTCADAGITTVHVDIAGQGGQDFSCDAGGALVLTEGAYTLTLTGYDAGGLAIYGGAKNVAVARGANAAVGTDLAAYGYFSWNFNTPLSNASPGCNRGSGADIEEVWLYVDGQQDAVKRYYCSTGLDPQSAVAMPYLAPGSHRVVLVAYDAQGYSYASSDTTFNVSAAPAVYQQTLNWEVGSANISWRFNANPQNDCAYWGATNMSFNFVDANGDEFFNRVGSSIGDGLSSNDEGSAGNVYACSLGSVVYNYLPAGTYGVEVQASGGVGADFGQYINYVLPNGTVPSVQVTAGVFTSTSSNSVLTSLIVPP